MTDSDEIAEALAEKPMLLIGLASMNEVRFGLTMERVHCKMREIASKELGYVVDAIKAMDRSNLKVKMGRAALKTKSKHAVNGDLPIDAPLVSAESEVKLRPRPHIVQVAAGEQACFERARKGSFPSKRQRVAAEQTNEVEHVAPLAKKIRYRDSRG